MPTEETKTKEERIRMGQAKRRVQQKAKKQREEETGEGKTGEGKTTEGMSTPRKIWEGIQTLFTWAVLLAATAMMIFTIVSVRTFDRNDRDLFGYKAYIVRSDSMSATDFDAGDLILVKEADPFTLKEGDIISYRSIDSDHFGETITHKIRSLTTNEEGQPAFITYGTATGVDDSTPVAYDQVLGKYQYTLKGVGAFFTFLKTVPGYVCCILLPFLLLILMQGVNSIRLFRQYKEEQMAEMEMKRQKELAEMAAEREKLAAERSESQKMLKELQRLQAQLTGQTAEETKE